MIVFSAESTGNAQLRSLKAVLTRNMPEPYNVNLAFAAKYIYITY